MSQPRPKLVIDLQAVPSSPWRSRTSGITTATTAKALNTPPTTSFTQVDEGGVCLSLPPGWLHFCITCTRPHSQKLVILIQRTGGETHTVKMCSLCQNQQYPSGQGHRRVRFSPHVSFLILQNHLKEPIRDVNAEADAMILAYRTSVKEQEDERVRQRRQFRMQQKKEQAEIKGKWRKNRCVVF